MVLSQALKCLIKVSSTFHQPKKSSFHENHSHINYIRREKTIRIIGEGKKKAPEEHAMHLLGDFHIMYGLLPVVFTNDHQKATGSKCLLDHNLLGNNLAIGSLAFKPFCRPLTRRPSTV